MATVTKGRTFVSGETVTPTKLNELVDLATVTSIVDADISASAAIASSKLSTAAQQALIPAGAVMPFAMNSAPAGWLAANGSTVSRATYAALFAAVGTTYGAGDGSTTFALPDLRGYFVRGAGTNDDGTAAGSFAAKQAGAFASHTHTASTSSAGAHSHTYGAQPSVSFPNTGTVPNPRAGDQLSTSVAGAHTHTVTVDATGGAETRPANIALLYCIKF